MFSKYSSDALTHTIKIIFLSDTYVQCKGLSNNKLIGIYSTLEAGQANTSLVLLYPSSWQIGVAL